MFIHICNYHIHMYHKLLNLLLISITRKCIAYLCYPFNSNSKDPIFSFARQRYFKFHSIISNWKWISSIQIISAIKNRFKSSKDFAVCMYHRFNNLSVHLLKSCNYNNSVTIDIIVNKN